MPVGAVPFVVRWLRSSRAVLVRTPPLPLRRYRNRLPLPRYADWVRARTHDQVQHPD